MSASDLVLLISAVSHKVTILHIVASLMLDPFGAISFNTFEISFWHILEVLLIAAGVMLVRKF